MITRPTGICASPRASSVHKRPGPPTITVACCRPYERGNPCQQKLPSASSVTHFRCMSCCCCCCCGASRAQKESSCQGAGSDSSPKQLLAELSIVVVRIYSGPTAMMPLLSSLCARTGSIADWRWMKPLECCAICFASLSRRCQHAACRENAAIAAVAAGGPVVCWARSARPWVLGEFGASCLRRCPISQQSGQWHEPGCEG